ncbi:MAG: hypothetical protein C0410_02045 [Anaerolinea sp.]|nr:hypothetical protein [Anaerolinea sp.]
MRTLFNPDGPLFLFGEQLFNIMVVSILWVICCIPIVTILPATSALYYVAVKQVRKNNGSFLNNFFGSFRDSLRTGIPLTCIVLIYATAMVAVIWTMNSMTKNGTTILASGYLSFAAKALLLPLLFIQPYLAPVISRFSMSVGALLKLSIVMSLRFFWRTILLLVLFTGSAILLWFIPYLIVVLPGACALVCSFILEPALRKYMPKHDTNEPIPWYWE